VIDRAYSSDKSSFRNFRCNFGLYHKGTQLRDLAGISRVYTLNYRSMKTALGTVLITEEEIRRRMADLGLQISKDFSGRSVTLVGILKGSFVFMADLIRAIAQDIPVEVDFMSVSSYGDATTTSGTIHIEKDLGISIEGKDVIIVED